MAHCNLEAKKVQLLQTTCIETIFIQNFTDQKREEKNRRNLNSGSGISIIEWAPCHQIRREDPHHVESACMTRNP